MENWNPVFIISKWNHFKKMLSLLLNNSNNEDDPSNYFERQFIENVFKSKILD